MIRTSIFCMTAATSVLANEDIPDQYPQSVLYEAPVEVIKDVWSAIGATAPPTYENAPDEHGCGAGRNAWLRQLPARKDWRAY